MNRILRRSFNHRSLMAVSIRGHRADLREFQGKFNGIQIAGLQVHALER